MWLTGIYKHIQTIFVAHGGQGLIIEVAKMHIHINHDLFLFSCPDFDVTSLAVLKSGNPYHKSRDVASSSAAGHRQRDRGR